MRSTPAFAQAGGAKPAPLVTASGEEVVTTKEWEVTRRPEILELFREHVYGRNAVERPAALRFETVEEDNPAFDGGAIRRRTRVVYAGPGGEGMIEVTLYLPFGEKPKACFLLILNRAPEIIGEAETNPAEFWPVRDIVQRGFAAAAFYNRDVAIDDPEDDFKSGVFGVFASAESRASDTWGAIAAWSWGASRVIDYLVTEKSLEDVPIAVIGHSRGGKAALWCGAQDQRVWLAISNESGCTGAALTQVTRGETIRKINTNFPHWFSRNYHSYNDRPAELPVDQHLLIALRAPRLVYVSSAEDDANADPAAEFQSCVEAGSVFELYGENGVGSPVMPAVGEKRHEGAIGYHMRTGEHDLKREDWLRFMEFAGAKLPRTIGS